MVLKETQVATRTRMSSFHDSRSQCGKMFVHKSVQACMARIRVLITADNNVDPCSSCGLPAPHPDVNWPAQSKTCKGPIDAACMP